MSELKIMKIKKFSVAANVREKIKKLPRGQVFSIEDIPETCGDKKVIQRSLSRLAQKGEIYRIRKGIYYKPLKNKYIEGEIVPPNIDEVLAVISRKYHEKIQIHGGAAANSLGLSTQVPIFYIYYTSGASRELDIVGIRVKLIHTSDVSLIKYAGTNIGLVIAALHYLGKELVSEEVVSKIRANLSEREFQLLIKANLVKWMHESLV
ncbi:DUF6088 family protein [Acinetobacter baumannii]|uniref:DUF6088 family protein n=1 Tax=Acinetobacter baumannii TaxID=470 RepID=UPI0022215780|nr:DUF6088 family protein [Acinetobacter baumannii]MCW1473923.1 DUF6088 family protein [Acinetobacter baumannii]MDV7431416.1 DUF6088 family protein [Acinetobacter baumannii]